jgi:hypothetical protein
MEQVSELRRGTRRPGVLVLMARLIGRDGQPICQEDVRSIECHVRSGDPEQASADSVASPYESPLEVRDVMLSELFTDDWTIDKSGFNFRHDVSPLLANCFLEEAGIQIDVLYRMLLVTGECAIVCFRIRRICNDRYRTISIDSQPDLGSACHATG